MKAFDAATDDLAVAFADGRISLDDFAEAATRLHNELPEQVAKQKAAEQAQKELNDQYRLAKELAGVVTPATRAYADGVDALQVALHDGEISLAHFNKGMEELRSELPHVKKAKQDLDESIKRGVSIVKQGETEQQKYEAAVKDLRAALKATEISQKQFDDSVRRMRLDNATRDVNEFSNALQMSGDALRNIGEGIRSLGMQIAAYTAPITAMGVAGVHSFSSFDDGMTKSLAIMRGVTGAMRAEMEDTARGISRNSVTAARDSASGYYYLSQAGFDAAQSIASLTQVEQFSVAGAFDMKEATDLLTDAMVALGLASKDTTVLQHNMERVSDVLVRAAQLGNASVQQFSEGLTKDAASIARQFGVEIEEVGGVLALFAANNLKGREAGTRFEMTLRELARASRANADEWEKHGLKVYDEVTGRFRGFVPIIRDMERVFGGMSDKQREATAASLGFQVRSFKGIRALLGFSGALEENIKQLQIAGSLFENTTADVAAEQLKSFASQMVILKNNLMDVGIEIGRVLTPVLLRLSEVVRRGLDWFRGLNDAQKKFLVAVGAVAVAIGPVLIMLGSLLVPVGAFISAVASMASSLAMFVAFDVTLVGVLTSLAAIGTVLSPIILVTTAVVALGTAFVGLAAWGAGLDGLRASFDTALASVKDFASTIMVLGEWMADNWQNLLRKENITIVLKTAGRLIVLFGGWLVQQFEYWSRQFVSYFVRGFGKLLLAAVKFAVNFNVLVLDALVGTGKLFETMFTDYLERSVAGATLTDQLTAVLEKAGREMKLTAERIGEETGAAMSQGMAAVAATTMGGGVARPDMPSVPGLPRAFQAQAAAMQADQERRTAAQAAQQKAAAEAAEKHGKAIEELTKKYKEEIATKGMSARQAEIWRLSHEGATDVMLRGLREMDAQIKAMELRDNVKDLTDKLVDQIKTFGMTSREIEIYRLKMDGASDAMLRAAKAARDVLTAMEKHKEIMDRGKKRMEEHRTPLEKYRETVSALREELAHGAISPRVFSEGLREALAVFDKEVKLKVRPELVTGIEAFDARSREGRDELAKFAADRAAAAANAGRFEREHAAAMRGMPAAAARARATAAAARATVIPDPPVARDGRVDPRADERNSAALLDALMQIKAAIEGKPSVSLHVADF